MERVQVNVEYCGLCNYEARCQELQKTVHKLVPDAEVKCKKGRQGSFEVQINDKVVYSKLSTLAFPDFNDVALNVQKETHGESLGHIRQQPITECVLQ